MPDMEGEQQHLEAVQRLSKLLETMNEDAARRLRVIEKECECFTLLEKTIGFFVLLQGNQRNQKHFLTD